MPHKHKNKAKQESKLRVINLLLITANQVIKNNLCLLFGNIMLYLFCQFI